MRLRRRRALNPRFARGIAAILVRQQQFDLVMMRGRHVRTVARLALALLRATGQQVALEDVSELELAGRRALETLLGTGVSLDLGHGYVRVTEGQFLCPSHAG